MIDAMSNRVDVVRRSYAAYETGDREALEGVLADDLVFFSPADVGIDRTTYFERCWPNHERLASFDVVRLEEVGDEVLLTYEATRTDGTRFRNTEVLGFDGDGRIARIEVYFGWEL